MKPFKFYKLELPGYKSTDRTLLEKSHEAYTGADDTGTEKGVTAQDAPSLPGSSTGETAVQNAMGVPGQDYEASWGISVSFRRIKL